MSADTGISTKSSFDLNASWMTGGIKNSRKKAACSPFHDLNEINQTPKKPLLMTTKQNPQIQQVPKINASTDDTTHLKDQNLGAKQPTVAEEGMNVCLNGKQPNTSHNRFSH